MNVFSLLRDNALELDKLILLFEGIERQTENDTDRYHLERILGDLRSARDELKAMRGE